jgi:hypothetical protein
MDDQAKVCEKCQGDVTQALRVGAGYCPACGADISEMREKFSGGRRGSRSLLTFWIMLLAPALLSLLTFSVGTLGKGPNDAAVSIGLVALLAGAIGSVYCGSWLATRFCRPGGGRLLVGVGIVIALGAVNLFMAVAGCVSSLNFH